MELPYRFQRSQLLTGITSAGPVVRVSPDQIDIADPAGARQIHRIKGEYLKAPFYTKIVPGVASVFSTTSVDVHRRYRKLLSGPISETGLQALLPQVDVKVRLAIQVSELPEPLIFLPLARLESYSVSGDTSSLDLRHSRRCCKLPRRTQNGIY